MDPAHWDNFPLLYQKLAHHWAQKDIVKHTINYFDYDRQGSESLNNMGFAPAPFWKKTGFKPVAHRLYRQIEVK